MEKIKKKNKSKKYKNIINKIVTIIFVVIISSLISLVVQNVIFPDKIPNIFGIKMLQVMSGSMSGEFEIGDIIIIEEVKDENSLKVGDIITYNKNSTIVTHRIINITKSYETLEFTTKGDANNVEDSEKIKIEEIEGKYIGKISILGNLITFMNKPIGMTIIVTIPIIIIILIILKDKNNEEKMANRKEKRLKYEIEKEREKSAKE